MMFTDTVGIIEALGRNTPTWTYSLPRYGHRNGETTPPTEPGRYWFKGRRFHKWRDAKDGEWIDDAGSLLDRDRDGTIDPYGGYWPCGDFIDSKGQWWGPVVAPWEQVA